MALGPGGHDLPLLGLRHGVDALVLVASIAARRVIAGAAEQTSAPVA